MWKITDCPNLDSPSKAAIHDVLPLRYVTVIHRGPPWNPESHRDCVPVHFHRTMLFSAIFCGVGGGDALSASSPHRYSTFTCSSLAISMATATFGRCTPRSMADMAALVMPTRRASSLCDMPKYSRRSLIRASMISGRFFSFSLRHQHLLRKTDGKRKMLWVKLGQEAQEPFYGCVLHGVSSFLTP